MFSKSFNTNASFVTGTGHSCATMASFTACKYGGGAITFVTDGQRTEDIPKILIELENEIYDRFPNTPVGREHAAMIINKLGIDVETNPYKILAWREMLMRDVTQDTIRQEIRNGEFWEWGIGSNPENFFTQFEAAKKENAAVAHGLNREHPTSGEGQQWKNYRSEQYFKEYGYRHTGTDIGGTNLRVLATTAGYVTGTRTGVAHQDSLNSYSEGNYVLIEDAGGNTHHYAHLFSVSSSTQVKDYYVLPGEQIGVSGNSGHGGWHLHYEVQGSGGSWGDPSHDLSPYDYM